MKQRLTVLLVLTALLSGSVAPVMTGQVRAAPERSHVAAVHTSARTAAFDKTRFVAHLAVAAFLVHYIYKKYKEGKLGRTHIFTDLKAVAAALIAYHEMKKAYDIAKTSHSKTLQALIAPIGALTGTLDSMASKLRHGDTSQIATANSQEGSLRTSAGNNGFAYKDQQPSGFRGF